MTDVIPVLALPDLGSIIDWMDDHEGAGSWAQGVLTLVSIAFVGIISLRESRHAYRMHLEALAAQHRQEEERRRSIQVACINVAEFASDRFKKAAEHARTCEDLTGIHEVFGPDFEIVQSTVAGLPFGELQDPELIKHMGQVMVSCVSMRRHLAALDTLGRRADLSDKDRHEKADGWFALMDRESVSLRFHTNRVARLLGFVTDREIRREGPTTRLTLWNRLRGRVAGMLGR